MKVSGGIYKINKQANIDSSGASRVKSYLFDAVMYGEEHVITYVETSAR